jgi:hypothetical protein
MVGLHGFKQQLVFFTIRPPSSRDSRFCLSNENVDEDEMAMIQM